MDTERISDDLNTKSSITYNDIATKLLKDKFLLTALELHTELLESGRKLKQLQDFFSNPGNFEFQLLEIPPRITRSGSQVTLDSLDLTRYSEDGTGQDERVAVLEFELRKARETISSLRNNLTVATESESGSPDKGSLWVSSPTQIKPHEQRALNFLINEYLLSHGYKLTSITFADENENQDFDDWDDVGLNIAKPPPLLTLYREGLKHGGYNLIDQSIQTDPCTMETEKDALIEDLNSQIQQLQIESAMNDCNNDTLIDVTNSNDNCHKVTSNNTNDISNLQDKDGAKIRVENTTTPSVDSASPDRFEMIEEDRKTSEALIVTEDTISNSSSSNVGDWTKLSLVLNEQISNAHKTTKPRNINLNLRQNKLNPISSNNNNCDPFRMEVFDMCYKHLQLDSDCFLSILQNITDFEAFVSLLTVLLPRIVPNVTVNKRDEVIPLLITGILLTNNSEERDKLLQQLFGLKKRPTIGERSTILSGLMAIAQYSDCAMIENEILPQCCEQITHKYVERRLLVTEACAVLMPHISNSIRDSFVLSMLQQMLDDREEIVRESVIKSLSLLFVLCDDNDKYVQCEKLVLHTINDRSSSVFNLALNSLFLVTAKWALDIDEFSNSFLSNLLNVLSAALQSKIITSPQQTIPIDKVQRILNILENLLPFLFVYVAQDRGTAANQKELPFSSTAGEHYSTVLANPLFFTRSKTSFSHTLNVFNAFLDENPNAKWHQLNWFKDTFLNELLKNVKRLSTNCVTLRAYIRLFTSICKVFGRKFTRFHIRPIVQNEVNFLEENLQNYKHSSLNLVPLYVVAVLINCDNSNEEEISNTLVRFMSNLLTVCDELKVPENDDDTTVITDLIKFTILELCQMQRFEMVVNALWKCVVHQDVRIKMAAGGWFAAIIGSCDAAFLTAKVVPALVTLANDTDLSVRCSSIEALGNLICETKIQVLHDKAQLQFQTFTADDTLMEHIPFQRQLIMAFTKVIHFTNAHFRQDVIIHHLSEVSTFLAHFQNDSTSKMELFTIVIDAVSTIITSTTDKQQILDFIPILNSLQIILSETPTLYQYKDTVNKLLKECNSVKVNIEGASNISSNTNTTGSGSANILKVNQGVEDMKQKMTKIFNKATANRNNAIPQQLQGIFKRKS